MISTKQFQDRISEISRLIISDSFIVSYEFVEDCNEVDVVQTDEYEDHYTFYLVSEFNAVDTYYETLLDKFIFLIYHKYNFLTKFEDDKLYTFLSVRQYKQLSIDRLQTSDKFDLISTTDIEDYFVITQKINHVMFKDNYLLIHNVKQHKSYIHQLFFETFMNVRFSLMTEIDAYV